MSRMSRIEIDDDLMVRYLTGDANPEEAMALADWLKTSANADYFHQFEATWRRSAGERKPTFSKRDAWNRVSSGIHVPVEAPSKETSIPYWRVGVAAALVAVALSGYFLFFRVSAEDTVRMGSVATTDGFRFVELPDRSTVTLHRNSELKYPDQFASSERRVLLVSGEAFFNVAHDAGKPFLVNVGDTEVKVVGTEFNVELADGEATIHVRHGRVLIKSVSDTATLATGQTGKVSAGKIEVSNAPVGNLYSYATQRLVFDDTPLVQVIHDLEDSYSYTFELKNQALENCRLTAIFYKDDIDKIVNLIAETLNLTAAKDGRHFTLEGEGCL